jgi:hypothetical protein
MVSLDHLAVAADLVPVRTGAGRIRQWVAAARASDERLTALSHEHLPARLALLHDQHAGPESPTQKMRLPTPAPPGGAVSAFNGPPLPVHRGHAPHLFHGFSRSNCSIFARMRCVFSSVSGSAGWLTAFAATLPSKSTSLFMKPLRSSLSQPRISV